MSIHLFKVYFTTGLRRRVVLATFANLCDAIAFVYFQYLHYKLDLVITFNRRRIFRTCSYISRTFVGLVVDRISSISSMYDINEQSLRDFLYPLNIK